MIPVHLFGNPADMHALRQIAREHGLHLIEDASEAHGATHDGEPVGSLGEVATFSFYGNKILATGEGGMVCTSDERVARRIRTLRGQGADPARQYWFEAVGYNYRMTNLACAIGAGQLARFEEFRAKREAIRAWYDEAISCLDLPAIRQAPTASSKPVLWMYSLVLRGGSRQDRDRVRAELSREGIETRPFFTALHTLPMYRAARHDHECETSRLLGDLGIMLPTHTRLTRPDVERIVRALATAMLETNAVACSG
jgi:perosamine synthetase